MACNCWTSGPMCCMRQGGLCYTASNKPDLLSIPQGWQCPNCRRVYGPQVDECPNCKPSQGYTYEEIMRKFFPNISSDEWYGKPALDTTAGTNKFWPPDSTTGGK